MRRGCFWTFHILLANTISLAFSEQSEWLCWLFPVACVASLDYSAVTAVIGWSGPWLGSEGRDSINITPLDSKWPRRFFMTLQTKKSQSSSYLCLFFFLCTLAAIIKSVIQFGSRCLLFRRYRKGQFFLKFMCNYSNNIRFRCFSSMEMQKQKEERKCLQKGKMRMSYQFVKIVLEKHGSTRRFSNFKLFMLHNQLIIKIKNMDLNGN